MEDTVRDAVFGNVGTVVSMRVSPEDAPVLATQFSPQFEAQDILAMNNRHFVCAMMIDGEKSPAFSGTTLKWPKAPESHLDEIIQHTRETYARPRAEVAAEIASTIEVPIQLKSKTERDKIKRASKEEERQATKAPITAADENGNIVTIPPRSNTGKQKISPSGNTESRTLGEMLNAIRVAADEPSPAEEKFSNALSGNANDNAKTDKAKQTSKNKKHRRNHKNKPETKQTVNEIKLH